MAAVRGMGSHHPCPICLVPADALPGIQVSQRFPDRTTQGMREVYEEAREAGTMAEREEILKEVGLRFVEVRIVQLF